MDLPPLSPPQRRVMLPPGVYFNPTPEEAVQKYLNRWIAGEEMPEVDAGLVVVGDDVYGHCPDALRRRKLPGYSRDYEYKWFFLSHHKLQSSRGGESKRVVRHVATGGRWKVEQRRERLDDGGGDVGGRNSLGFYLPVNSKTSWMMEEYTSSLCDGGAASGEDNMVPVLCKIYLTPRATDDERRALFGEDGVQVGPDGSKKKARVTVPAAWFDRVAALLGHGQPVAAAAQALPVPDELGHHHQGLVEEALPEPGYLGHYHYHGHFVEALPEPDYRHQHAHVAEAPPEQGYLDQRHFAAEQTPASASSDLGHYHHHGHSVEAAPEQGDLGHDQGPLAAAPAPLLTPEEYFEMLPIYESSPEMLQMISMGYTVPDEQSLPQLLGPTAGGYDMGSSTAAMNTCAAAAQEAERTPPAPQIRPNAAEAMATATAETMPRPRGLPPELAFNDLPSVQGKLSYGENNFGELVAEQMPPLIMENADACGDEAMPDLEGIMLRFPDSCTLVMPNLDFGHDMMTSSATPRTMRWFG